MQTSDGTQCRWSVADVTLRDGAFMIYHEGGRRYIPIKFSVRGRDLASDIQDLQGQITNNHAPLRIQLYVGGRVRRPAQGAAAAGVDYSVSVLTILLLLYMQFRTWKDALIVLGTAVCIIGGILALLVTHTSFSISAAVGFTSLIGVATLGR